MPTKVPLQPPPRNLDSLSLEFQVREMSKWMYEVYRRMFNTKLLSISASGITHAISIVSGSTTVTSDITQVTAPCTLTLPLVAGLAGQIITIDNAHAGNTSLVASGGQLIEGETSQTLSGHCAMSLYPDGTGWRII